MDSVERVESSYDAVVVGARCAGASTALLLARAGLRVLAVDRSPRGSDTVSTLALMRGGTLQLHRWGLLEAVKSAGTPPVRTTAFRYDDDEEVLPIKPRDGVDALYAPRRTVLDPMLADAAAAAGADVVHGVRVVDLMRSSDGRVQGAVLQDRGGVTRRVSAAVVIGADGRQSTIARLVGATAYRFGSHAVGVIYGFWRDVGLPGYHWCYRVGRGIGTIQTNDDLTCVFVAVPAARFLSELRHDFAAGHQRVMIETAPDIAARLAASELEGPLRGYPGQPGYFRQSWGPGWALVGDAGYFKDPYTAHGITDALRDSELLSRAVLGDTPAAYAEYQATRDHLSERLFAVTDSIASFAWDLATLKELHRDLSKEMQREVAWMLEADSHAAAAKEVVG